jgi:hypothetical protein
MKQLVLKLYLYLPVIALILGVWFVFAAEDSYRYACQDPANWENPVCQVPMCKATGACTENLVYDGEAAAQVLETSPEILTPEPQAEPVEPEPIDQILTDIENQGENP